MPYIADWWIPEEFWKLMGSEEVALMTYEMGCAERLKLPVREVRLTEDDRFFLRVAGIEEF